MGVEADAPLRGRTVLVTRPVEQAGRLCDLIGAAGGRALHLPALVILPLRDEQPARLALTPRVPYDAVIFVSRNAVRFAESLNPAFVSGFSGAVVYAVGKGTAAELEARGLRVQTPHGGQSGSEALLELDGLRADRLRGRAILIVRGSGGRARLSRELARRGARVTHAEVYRRAEPAPDPDRLRRIWRDELPDVIVITSVQGLEQLVAMTGTEWRAALLGTALVTISERVASRAADLGFRAGVRVAPAASDEGLVDAIRRVLGDRA